MFPTGGPGIALLVLRVALAVMLVAGIAGKLTGLGPTGSIAAPAVVAIALCLGFFTPAVSLLAIVLEIATWVTTGGPIEAVHVCAVLNAITLSLLGPGSYSVDARLFGRRQVILRSFDDS